MYYHFAILLLFRPFIKLRFIGSRVSPHDVCCQAADAIITLLRSYDQLYTLQRTPSFIPYIVMASCIQQLVRINTSTNSNGNSGQTQFRQGIKDLSDMTVCHGFARRALNILRFFAEQWECSDDAFGGDSETVSGTQSSSGDQSGEGGHGLAIGEGGRGGGGGRAGEIGQGSSEEIKESCLPSSTSFNLFCPSMSDFIGGNGAPGSLSALFAPFPMQGLPLLAGEGEMERDGFSRVV
jgi:hypothetical protein